MKLATAVNDVGTTNNKSIFVVDGVEHRFMFPTAIGLSRDLEFGTGQGLEVDGVSSFIGETALKYSRPVIWGRTENWLMSDHYLRLHLYCIAYGISQHIDKLKSNRQAFSHLLNETWSVNLTTAFPYANWQDRNEIAENLAGDYQVRLLENDLEVKIQINLEIGKSKKGNQVVKRPRPMLQGWAAFLANGQPEISLDQPFVVVIDLGGRNWSYCTMEWNGRGWQPVDGEVGSTEGGTLDITDELMKRIAREYRIELNHQQAIQALISGRVGEHDISKICSELITPYIDGLLAFIGATWKERTRQPFIREFLLTGGGSILLGKEIKKQHYKITVSEDGIWDGARGMLAVS